MELVLANLLDNAAKHSASEAAMEDRAMTTDGVPTCAAPGRIADMPRDAILPKLRDFFAREAGDLIAVYLFGSVARGEDRPDSDVDLGVVFGSHAAPSLEQLDRLAAMQSALCELLERDVDLISFDAAAPDLVHHAFLDKILVFEGDHDARIEFEVQALNEYFDLLPLLLSYRRTVLRRA